MTVQIRGGFPRTLRLTVTTTFDPYRLDLGRTNYLQILNRGANVLRIYWSQADMTADVNYIELGTTSPDNFFQGPVELLDGYLYIRGNGGSTDVTITSYHPVC